MDVSFGVPVEFRHCANYGFAFVYFLNTVQSNSEMFLSVFREQPCDGRCCSCAVYKHLIFRGRVSMVVDVTMSQQADGLL